MKIVVWLVCCFLSVDASASIQTILLGKKVEIYKKVKVTEIERDTVAVYLEMDGERGLGFTDSNESYFFLGMLYSDDGTNLTEKYVLKEVDYLAPGVKDKLRDKPKSEVWDVLMRTQYIFKGEGVPKAWIVYASECVYCQKLHSKMLESGKFDKYEKMVAWVPVTIGGSKAHVTASALSIKEQLVLMEPVNAASDIGEYEDAVRNNTKILGDKIKMLTPTIVVKQGEKVSVIPGMKLGSLDEVLGL